MRLKIGIVSDTHDFLRQEIIEDFKDCDYILHAGDIIKEDILLRLKELSKVIVVKGNNDYLELKKEESFDIGGYLFYMTHQKGEHQDVDFYIYGHSHKYACYRKDSTVYLNPGGCGKRRFSLPLTYMILYIDHRGYRIERRVLE